MFPKKNRNSKKDIEKIFKSSFFVCSPNLTFKFIKNTEKIKKISFITPKNISKKAVDRNLLRRRGYFIFKKYINQIPFGFFGVIIFNKKSKEIFGGKKNKKHNPILNLEKELFTLINKV